MRRQRPRPRRPASAASATLSPTATTATAIRSERNTLSLLAYSLHSLRRHRARHTHNITRRGTRNHLPPPNYLSTYLPWTLKGRSPARREIVSGLVHIRGGFPGGDMGTRYRRLRETSHCTWFSRDTFLGQLSYLQNANPAESRDLSPKQSAAIVIS